MALIGFDDLELGNILHPALTVIRQPAALLGETAARLLFHRVAGDRPMNMEAQRVVLPVELVLRHSCGCAYTLELEAAPALFPAKAAQTSPRAPGSKAAPQVRAASAKMLAAAGSKAVLPAARRDLAGPLLSAKSHTAGHRPLGSKAGCKSTP